MLKVISGTSSHCSNDINWFAKYKFLLVFYSSTCRRGGLEQCADLHMAQLIPPPLTVSCFSKIQIGFTFLVPAHLASPGKGPLNGCVCVNRVNIAVDICALPSTIRCFSIIFLYELFNDGHLFNIFSKTRTNNFSNSFGMLCSSFRSTYAPLTCSVSDSGFVLSLGL